MQPRRSAAQKFLALPAGVLDAERPSGLRVIAQRIQLSFQMYR